LMPKGRNTALPSGTPQLWREEKHVYYPPLAQLIPRWLGYLPFPLRILVHKIFSFYNIVACHLSSTGQVGPLSWTKKSSQTYSHWFPTSAKQKKRNM
jgi:hypothetical protein